MGAGGSIKKAPEDGKPEEEKPEDAEAKNAMAWLSTNLGTASDAEIAEALKGLPEEAKAKLLRATAPTNGDKKDFVFEGSTPEEMEAAATKMQSIQRGKQARAEVEKKKSDLAGASGEEKKEEKKEEEKKEEAPKGEVGPEATPEEMEAAATKVQSLQRGKQARAEVEKKKSEKAVGETKEGDGEKKEEEPKKEEAKAE